MRTLKIPGRGGQVFSLGNSRQGGCHLPDGSEIPREGVKINAFPQGAVFKNCLEIPSDPHEKLVSGNSKGPRPPCVD